MDYVCKVIGDLSIEEKDFKLRMSFNEIVDLTPEDFKISPRLRAALRNREIEVYTPTLHKKAKKVNGRKMHIVQERVLPLKNNVAPAAAVEIPKGNLNNSDINEMKEALSCISDKVSSCVSRLDLLITKVIESNNTLNSNFDRFFREKQNVQVTYENAKLDHLLEQVIQNQTKFNTFIEDQHRTQLNNKAIPQASASQVNDEKLSKLLDSVEKLLQEGLKIDAKNLNIQNTNGNGYSKIKTEDKVHFDDDIPVFVPKLDKVVENKNIVTKSVESEGTDSILEKLKNLK